MALTQMRREVKQVTEPAELLQELRERMSTITGRRGVARELAVLDEDPFSQNAMLMAHTCGRQRAARDLKRLLIANFKNEFVLMVREETLR